MLNLYEIQISASVNKVLLEQSQVHLFTLCLRLLLNGVAELSSCHQDCMACKAWTIYDPVLVKNDHQPFSRGKA